MRNFLFRTTSLLLVLAAAFAPAYAHHGTGFLDKAMEGNAAEVKMAEMAQTKAQDQRVKDFAAMVVKDHTMALNKMEMLLEDRYNAKVTTKHTNWHDMKLNKTHQQTLTRLSNLSGADFDREFMSVMTTAHQNSILAFEKHIGSHGGDSASAPATSNVKVDYAKDPDTIAFARETLPTLKHHLEQAQMIQGTPISKR